jgi:hypothetical protein
MGATLLKEYIHRELHQEIIAIGGHYVITDEVRFPFANHQVFYLKGYAVVDRSCCGQGGCAFVHVQGFVVDWKVRVDEDGNALSLIEPISGERMREEIREWISRKEVFHQVQFA